MNVQANAVGLKGSGRASLFAADSRSALNPSARPPARIITLASLSRRIADRFIAETLAQALNSETGHPVLLIQLECSEGGASLQEWGRLQSQLNGEFGLRQHLQKEGGVGKLRVRLSDDPSEAALVVSLVQHCLRYFAYVLLHIGADAPVPVLLECLIQAERSFLLLQPTVENLYHRDLLLREVRMNPRSEERNLRTIVCREQGEEHFNELLKQMGSSVHGFIHGCPTAGTMSAQQGWPGHHFHSDVRRLAREIGRCRLGLALSSGGARSLAHIGVIQVLEENGIEFDVVAGCSMGAYIGAVWAFGYDGVFMERLAREVEHRWGLLELIDPFILPRQGFLRGEKVKRRLKRSIGDAHFSELVRPLRIVATHLTTLDRAVFSTGEVAQAVHASSAIPGACVPVKIDDELYLDGGIADPLPVDVLEEMGIERIIAVNTIPTAAYLRRREELERELEARRRRRGNKLKRLINHYLNYFAPGNLLDTILRSFNGAQMRVADLACLRADVVLRPLSFDGRWHDFRRPGKYIALGRREAEEHLEEIKALVARKAPVYEPEFTHDPLGTTA